MSKKEEIKLCGAKTKSTKSGGACKNRAMENGRCKFHGGMSTGAPKGNKNNLSHGLYSKFYSEEELKAVEERDLVTSSLDDEITHTRIQIMRLEKLHKENTLVDDEEIETTGTGEQGAFNSTIKKKKRIDTYHHYDKMVARLESLISRRDNLKSSIEININTGPKYLRPDEDMPEDIEL